MLLIFLLAKEQSKIETKKYIVKKRRVYILS